MSTEEKSLYKQVTVKNKNQKPAARSGQHYRGLSTVNEENPSYVLYDISLIKQDLLNHFHIRQGEKLENPEFGCIIWDILFEPLTELMKDLIVKNVTDIVNYDPRISVDRIVVDSYESGIQIECELTFLDYNISESMRFQFDEKLGLV